jgi:hypothetical protein
MLEERWPYGGGWWPAPEEPPILFEKSKLRYTRGSLKNEEPHNTGRHHQPKTF